MKFSFGTVLWIIIFFPIAVIGVIGFAAWPIAIVLEVYSMIFEPGSAGPAGLDTVAATLLMVVVGSIAYVIDGWL
jgi:hypothetical protein